MQRVSSFYFLGLSICLLTVGCQPKPSPDETSPKIEMVSKERLPKLIVSPKTMDLTATQKSISSLPSTTHAEFFIHPRPTAIQPTERNGAKFEHVITLNGKELTLRGVTARKFEMTKISLLTIYSVALYLPEVADVSKDIPDVKKVLILEYHIDVPKEKVVAAIRENVAANLTVNQAAVEPYFFQLSDAFDSPKKGDRYEFSYIPGRGTAMIKGGKILTLIPTREFEEAFFGIWLSPHGKDMDMRCELLALPCPPKASLNPVNIISANLGGAKNKLDKLKKFVL